MTMVLTLLVAGAMLLLLESLLPGAIAGIAGCICLLAGTIIAYRDLGTEAGNLVLLAVSVGLIVGTILWVKYFPQSRLTRRFVSHRTVGEIGNQRPDLLHQTGVALTTLRPSGTAIINHQRVDVVSEGPLLEPGTPVKVIAIEGIRVVVRPV